MRRLLSLTVCLCIVLAAFGAQASSTRGEAEVLPTLTRVNDPGGPVLRRPTEIDGALFRTARALDAILTEAAQDLGFSVKVAQSGDESTVTDDALITLSKKGWVISGRLWAEGEGLRLRLVAVAPESKVMLVRSELISVGELEMRAVVMLRDLVVSERRAGQELPPTPVGPEAKAELARSEGRAVLAINSAAFGAYVGFAVQRSSGSDDPRLTYPLMALGTGVGFGAAMIVADEWAIGIGDSWYLAAGIGWPGTAAFLLSSSYGAHADDRHAYAVLGGLGGVSLAATSLSFGAVSEGDAVLAHSGGVFGLLLGGVGQMIYEGRSDITPERGMGYGTAAGSLATGTLAHLLDFSPARVLMVDLAASLGALAGAAAASPTLLVDEELGESGNRIWLSSVALGTLVGGGLGVWLTAPPAGKRGDEQSRAGLRRLPALPYVGPIGEARTRAGRTLVFGAGVRGQF